jgi:hypothetical protein
MHPSLTGFVSLVSPEWHSHPRQTDQLNVKVLRQASPLCLFYQALLNSVHRVLGALV